MLQTVLSIVLAANLVKPPKQPDLGFAWKLLDVRYANEMKVSPEWYRDTPVWIRLYGIDVPSPGDRGYSGAREDLELLFGRWHEVYVEDEDSKHPVNRNAFAFQYLWITGKLVQFELVRDGWAKVNDEGRKGRYGKLLIDAEAEAKKFHEGRWAGK
jgi:endonuclease YncB( thermonuclease family)